MIKLIGGTLAVALLIALVILEYAPASMHYIERKLDYLESVAIAKLVANKSPAEVLEEMRQTKLESIDPIDATYEINLFNSAADKNVFLLSIHRVESSHRRLDDFIYLSVLDVHKRRVIKRFSGEQAEGASNNLVDHSR